MPAKSKKQQRLMAAAEHGAQFPMAKKVRSSMTHDQMRDFAKTKTKGLPNKKKKKKGKGKRPSMTSSDKDMMLQRMQG